MLFTTCVSANERFEEIWAHARLYENPDSGGFQSFVLSGRLQADLTYFDADQGSFKDYVWRRFRFGFKARFSGKWLLHTELDFNLNDDLEDSYDRLTDAYVARSFGH